MSLENQTNRFSYAGNDSTTDFPFPIYVLSPADIKAYLVDAEGEANLLEYGTDYEFDGEAEDGVYPDGGTVTLVDAPATGETLLMYREPSLVQTLELENNGSLPVSSIEQTLDKLMMILQRHDERLDRAVGLQDSDDDDAVMKLPLLDERASKFFAFDAEGQPIASDGGLSGSITTSVFGASLVDDSDAATARNTLGMGSAAAIRALAGLNGSHVIDTLDIDTAYVYDQTAKGDPASGDAILINDSEASNVTKKMTLSNLFALLNAQRNYLYNGNFEIWQRGTSTTIANGATAYLADRWYAKNSLGTAGVLTYSRVAATEYLSGLYGAKIQITTAPTASQVNGCEFYQTMGNADFQELFSDITKMSFRVKVKALGNVTGIGISLMYRTTEAKVDTLIGSEQSVTVNTSTFTDCTLENQQLGTSMTSAGVIGVRIRILNVSSGNTYDLNNGFICEQAMLAQGMKPAYFRRRHNSYSEELQACQRFYEKSYDLSHFPGSSTTNGAFFFPQDAGTANANVTVPFKTRKRYQGYTPAIYDLVGNASKISDFNGSNVQTNNVSAFTQEFAGEAAFQLRVSSGTGRAAIGFHWVVDAEI